MTDAINPPSRLTFREAELATVWKEFWDAVEKARKKMQAHGVEFSVEVTVTEKRT